MAKRRNSSKRVMLASRAYEAYRSLRDLRYRARAGALMKSEPAFALLLWWCEIELMLKIIRYRDNIQEEWPNELNFIRASWGPLKHIKGIDSEAYNLILGCHPQSLWKLRNRIAHTGLIMTLDEAKHYLDAASIVHRMLRGTLPKREELLAKKRRSNAQLMKKS